jgi:hypothetical protein
LGRTSWAGGNPWSRFGRGGRGTGQELVHLELGDVLLLALPEKAALLLELPLRLADLDGFGLGAKAFLTKNFFLGLETVVLGPGRGQVTRSVPTVALLASLVEGGKDAEFAN